MHKVAYNTQRCKSPHVGMLRRPSWCQHNLASFSYLAQKLEFLGIFTTTLPSDVILPSFKYVLKQFIIIVDSSDTPLAILKLIFILRE